MPAILFGSISTIVDTSELQREAFNEAFSEHGLDWRWEPPEYRKMLVSAGGQARIEEYARSKGVSVDAGAIHATFTLALERLGETAGDCVAIEDNLDGVSAAAAAGLAVFAFPNEGTIGHDFSGATATVDRLDIDELSSARSSK
jgi:beta-phosphoglucomutase-like phosphatase (HAD superfamily)